MKKVKQKAQQLSKADPARKWTARDIEQATFAAHHVGVEDPSDMIERPSYSSQARAAKAKDTVKATTKSPKKSGAKATKEDAGGLTKSSPKMVKTPRSKRKAIESSETRPAKRKRDAVVQGGTVVKRQTRSTNTLKKEEVGAESVGLRRSTRSRKRNEG